MTVSMEIAFKEIEWVVVNVIYLASDEERWWALMKTVINLWIL